MSLKSPPSTKRKPPVRSVQLERQIRSLQERVSALEQAKPIIVPIETLAPDPFEVVKPFHAVVEGSGDNYIATFYDANISASGDTKEEAIFNLKDMIVGAFDLLEEHAGSLGRDLARQRVILKRFVRKTG